ncbi:MAG TPA: GGDEF domain-containing protein, partial [Comamonadaceae bacterium]|nr:GGDEF domain-containing protein [Comamonadaceae bacterium]
MSGCFGCAVWARAHASRRGVQSPDFTPTRRAVAFAGGLRRCGACG